MMTGGSTPPPLKDVPEKRQAPLVCSQTGISPGVAASRSWGVRYLRHS